MAQSMTILLFTVLFAGSSAGDSPIDPNVPAFAAGSPNVPVFAAAGYSPLIRPNDQGPPVEVDVSMYISMIAIKSNRMDAVFYMRTSWNDPRLKAKQEQSVATRTYKADLILSKLWSPDLFFTNAVKPTQVIEKGFVRIKQNGDVLHSQLLRQAFGCPGASMGLALQKGKRECTIELESYGLSNDDILIKATNTSKSFGVDVQSVMNGELYQLTNYTTSQSVITLSTGNYTRTSFKLGFQLNDRPMPQSYLYMLERGWDD